MERRWQQWLHLERFHPLIRYYEYHHSRGGDVVKQLIGEDYQGVLGSDFYAGYNIHHGLHQRCWVHFLRDIHDLKKLHPQDEVLFTWARDVKAAYLASGGLGRAGRRSDSVSTTT